MIYWVAVYRKHMSHSRLQDLPEPIHSGRTVIT